MIGCNQHLVILINLNKIMSKLGKPIGDRVLLKVVEEQSDKTAGGIFIPESAKTDDVKYAEVIAVGDGLYSASGILIPTTLSVGDRVILPPYHQGNDIKLQGEKYVLLRESEVLMKVEE